MRTGLLTCILAMGLMVLATGCKLLPLTGKTRILRQPQPRCYLNEAGWQLLDGGLHGRSWGAVWSDRVGNHTQISLSNDMTAKALDNLQPLYVLRKKKGMAKVAALKTDVNPGTTRGWVPRKSLNRLGWIALQQLLCWPTALKDMHSGQAVKAIACVGHSDMLQHPEVYFERDSLILFTAPDLQTKTATHIAPGSLLYVFKLSEDGKSCLVGGQSVITPENASHVMLGWISRNAVKFWGTGPAFTWNGTEDNASAGLLVGTDTMATLPVADLSSRTRFENIFPLASHHSPQTDTINTHYLDNILDYSRNKVYNVLGQPVYYNRYREIVGRAQRLNVVFVIDAGAGNRLYLPAIKSVMQDIQLYFDTTTPRKLARFGAVMYKRNPCSGDSLPDMMGLSPNYTDMVSFIDCKATLAGCADQELSQPVYAGISEACTLLSPYPDETNIIVVAGTTGDRPSLPLADVATAVSKVQARLLFFQTVNKTADTYNDFVLAAEKMIMATAQNLVLFKKERLVNVSDVIPDHAFSLQAGDSGTYYLDYPTRSMTQAIVSYPRKGQTMMPGVLKRNFDTLINQVLMDNRHVAQSLHAYFRSNIGVSQTYIRPAFEPLFEAATQPVSPALASMFTHLDPVFWVPAHCAATTAQPNYGVLLQSQEYDKVASRLQEVFLQSGGARKHFFKRRAVRSYLRYLRQYRKAMQLPVSRREIRRITPAGALRLYTGYICTDSSYNALQLRRLKKKPRAEVMAFFRRLQQASVTMTEQKYSPAIQIDCRGTRYYWLSKPVLP